MAVDTRFIKLADVEERFLSNAENKAAWDASEEHRLLGLMLAEVRIMTGKSQKELAHEADWDKGFVSRLEGAQGGFPGLQTLARYLSVCGAELVLSVRRSEEYGRQLLAEFPVKLSGKKNESL